MVDKKGKQGRSKPAETGKPKGKPARVNGAKKSGTAGAKADVEEEQDADEQDTKAGKVSARKGKKAVQTGDANQGTFAVTSLHGDSGAAIFISADHALEAEMHGVHIHMLWWHDFRLHQAKHTWLHGSTSASHA